MGIFCYKYAEVLRICIATGTNTLSSSCNPIITFIGNTEKYNREYYGEIPYTISYKELQLNRWMIKDD